MYEVPETQLTEAFEADELLQKLLAEQEAMLERHEKKQDEQVEQAKTIRHQAAENRAEAKRLRSAADELTRKANNLARRTRPPRLTELKRRINRRRGTIRKQQLNLFLATQKQDFLQKWRDTQKKMQS